MLSQARVPLRFQNRQKAKGKNAADESCLHPPSPHRVLAKIFQNCVRQWWPGRDSLKYLVLELNNNIFLIREETIPLVLMGLQPLFAPHKLSHIGAVSKSHLPEETFVTVKWILYTSLTWIPLVRFNSIWGIHRSKSLFF